MALTVQSAREVAALAHVLGGRLIELSGTGILLGPLEQGGLRKLLDDPPGDPWSVYQYRLRELRTMSRGVIESIEFERDNGLRALALLSIKIEALHPCLIMVLNESRPDVIEFLQRWQYLRILTAMMAEALNEIPNEPRVEEPLTSSERQRWIRTAPEWLGIGDILTDFLEIYEWRLDTGIRDIDDDFRARARSYKLIGLGNDDAEHAFDDLQSAIEEQGDARAGLLVALERIKKHVQDISKRLEASEPEMVRMYLRNFDDRGMTPFRHMSAEFRLMVFVSTLVLDHTEDNWRFCQDLKVGLALVDKALG